MRCSHRLLFANYLFSPRPNRKLQQTNNPTCARLSVSSTERDFNQSLIKVLLFMRFGIATRAVLKSYNRGNVSEIRGVNLERRTVATQDASKQHVPSLRGFGRMSKLDKPNSGWITTSGWSYSNALTRHDFSLLFHHHQRQATRVYYFSVCFVRILHIN